MSKAYNRSDILLKLHLLSELLLFVHIPHYAFGKSKNFFFEILFIGQFVPYTFKG